MSFFMAGQNKKLMLAAVVGLVAVAGLALVVYLGGESARAPLPQAARPPAQAPKLKDFAGEPVQAVYESSVKLNEPVTVTFRFRDYADLPADFGGAADLDRILKPQSGQARFVVKEFDAVDQLDQFNQAGEGDTYYYALFDFAGNTGNPRGPKIHPSSLQETGWDAAPQLVIIAGGKMAYLDVKNTKTFSRAKGLVDAWNVDLSQPKISPLGAVWPNAKGYEPDLAIRYVDPSGAVKFIQVNYKQL